MKSVLITGVFGFLGSRCLEHYRKRGYRVAGIGRSADAAPAQLTLLDNVCIGALTPENLGNFTDSFDLIVHCAGSGSVGKSLQDPLHDYADTVEATRVLLEYMRCSQSGARLVMASSAAVYGDKYTAPIRESNPIDAISPYGHHKELAEQLCRDYASFYALRISIVRFFSIYGPGLRKQLLWDACNKISAPGAQELEFFGSGTEIRDFIEIGDALRLIDIAASVDAPFVILNGGTGEATCIDGLVRLLADQLAPGVTIRFNGQTRAGDPHYLCADTALAQEYGWRPETKLAEGVRRYVAWYRADAR